MQTADSRFAANTSGQGPNAAVPPEVRGWNWGAFLLTWIWGIGNGTYIALLAFVPLVNLAMPFVLGAMGTSWAWRNKRWESIDQFKRVQRSWALWGLGVVGALVALMWLGGAATFALPRFQAAKLERAGSEARAIRQAALSYSMVGKSACPSVGELVANKYLEAVTTDPWGEPYRIVCDEDETRVSSNGPDRRADTDDDIRVPSSASY
jgi:hypothetical protein